MLKKYIKIIISDEIVSTFKRYVNRKTNINEVKIIFSLIKHKVGIMVDVGANNGDSFNEFAIKDWRIFAFEPDQKSRKILEEKFSESTKIVIDPRAVSDKDQENVVFYRSETNPYISSLCKFHSSHDIEVKVQTITLKSYFQENKIKLVDFLKIDAEGYDFFVLKGIDFNQVTIDLILCEFENKKSIPLGYTFNDLAIFLQNQGYHVLVSEWYPLKSYKGPFKWRNFAIFPCELIDTGGNGNIFAVKDKNLYRKLLIILWIQKVKFDVFSFLRKLLNS